MPAISARAIELRFVGQRRQVGVFDVLEHVLAGAAAEDHQIDQRVGAETVRAVHGDAGDSPAE